MEIEKIEKNVAVMMSFGGSDRTRQRRSILEFLRIKENIEKHLSITGCGTRMDTQIRYKVNHAMTDIGSIPEQALKVIYEADILVALINENNANVIYELAVRNLLKGTLVLLVEGDPEEEGFLPIYLKTMGYIRYDSETRDEMRQCLDQLAVAAAPLSFNTPIPEPLAEAVEERDRGIREHLRDAFSKIETNPNAPPGGVSLVQELDPGKNLASWEAFYPYNCVQARWNKMRDQGLKRYDPADLDGEPIVYTANDYYFEMLDYRLKQKTYSPDENALTSSMITDKLSKSNFVDPLDFNEWKEDQSRLMQEIVFKSSFARARVPLRFNSNHPREEYRGKLYLPTLVATRTVGKEERPHATYYLVVFVEMGVK